MRENKFKILLLGYDKERNLEKSKKDLTLIFKGVNNQNFYEVPTLVLKTLKMFKKATKSELDKYRHIAILNDKFDMLVLFTFDKKLKDIKYLDASNDDFSEAYIDSVRSFWKKYRFRDGNSQLYHVKLLLFDDDTLISTPELKEAAEGKKPNEVFERVRQLCK